ncbi:hypothetical protein DL771_010653 [Monosporascus sp. 5C6A]|nr:hypothetical protein DL771_010653 [Monosporascus sp. 5C6A]
MCRRYLYHTLCSNQACPTVVSNKLRNAYCREALDARRLGHCETGAKITEHFFDQDGSGLCGRCKSLSRQQGRRANSKSGCSNSSEPQTAVRERKRKACNIFEHAFEHAIEEEIEKWRWCEPEAKWDETTEPYVVQSPAERSRDVQQPKRRRQAKKPTTEKHDDGKQSPKPMQEPEPLVDHYSLQKSYQMRETLSRCCWCKSREAQ